MIGFHRKIEKTTFKHQFKIVFKKTIIINLDPAGTGNHSSIGSGTDRFQIDICHDK